MVENDKTTKAPIAIIERNVVSVLVASDDLKAGDDVVTEGVQLLREGGTVRVRQPTAWTPFPSTQDPPTAEDLARRPPRRRRRAPHPGGRGDQPMSGGRGQARRPDGAHLAVRPPARLHIVINLLIIVAGLAAFNAVEIRELPNVDRPVITVTTSFQGASAEVVDRQLTSTIESAVARVAGIASISSSSRFGQSRVTVEFTDSTDLNVAASDIRDAVAGIANQLPDDADESRIVKADADADAIMRLAVLSNTLPIEDLTTLVDDRIADRVGGRWKASPTSISRANASGWSISTCGRTSWRHAA